MGITSAIISLSLYLIVWCTYLEAGWIRCPIRYPVDTLHEPFEGIFSSLLQEKKCLKSVNKAQFESFLISPKSKTKYKA